MKNKMPGGRIAKLKVITAVLSFTILLFIMSISVIHMTQLHVFAQSEELDEIDYIELLIKEGRLTETHYVELFPVAAAVQEDKIAYYHYLEGVWAAYNREYDNALEAFDKVLKLVEDKSNHRLEMLTLEKTIEINDLYGDLITYQTNAFRLKELSIGENDKLYIKALYAIANSHFQTFNDNGARSYLTVVFEESERLDYDLGMSLYHLLYGKMELSYAKYDDAYYHFQKSEVFALSADKLLGYSYNKVIEMYLARSESLEGNVDMARARLSKLFQEIEKESDYLKRDIYYEYGETSRLMGHYDEAIKYYQLALTNDYLVTKRYQLIPLSSKIYIKLGFSYAQLERYDEAVGYFIKAYDLISVNNSDKYVSEQVSALNAYEIDELQRELDFKQKLRQANEETIALQREYLIIGFGLIMALIFSIIVMLYMIYRKNRIQKKLYVESITDYLTKVFNRGHIIDLLEDNKVRQSCILMMDIDDFKMINDTFGHVVGDKVLVRVADVIALNLREDDSVGRYGGEEFLVILKNTSLEDALTVAERIRSAIASLEWEEDITTTISIGLMQSYNTDTDQLLAEVDLLMYRAKHLGKNRVVF